MKKFILTLLPFLSMFQSVKADYAQANGIEIWYETFGDKNNSPLLLIMGGFCQGIQWPKAFCETLAEKGFYVIRYDQRDTGYTTCVNFKESPYDFIDMAKDAAGLLDYLNIKKASVCGFSMGGTVAQLLAVHFPEKVSSLTLISATIDLRPCSLAYDKQYPTDLALTRPKQVYLDWMHRFLSFPPQSFEEKLQERVDCWAILNGDVIPFEEPLYREIHREFLNRLKHPESLTNHLDAVRLSFDMTMQVSHQVIVPTVVIQGTEDPIIQPDHGKALSAAIPHSKYIELEGMGHVLNGYFNEQIANEIEAISN